MFHLLGLASVLAFTRPSHLPSAGRQAAVHPRGRVTAAIDVNDDLPRVRFNRQLDGPAEWTLEDAPAAEPEQPAGVQKRVLSVNERLEQRIDASVARLPRTPSKIEYTPVDLNGIQPWAALAGGVLYSAFAIGAWSATTAAAEWFTAHPPPQDIYVAMRVASIVRTVIIGLTSMFAGISAVTSVGMYGLFARVTYGVLTGELDPNLVAEPPTAAEKAAAAETDGVKQALDVLLPREWRR